MSILLALIACQGQEPSPDGPQSPQVDDPIVVAEEETLGETQDEEQASLGRKFKRMTLPQVRDAMEQVSGGIIWQGNESDWNDYADTLGVPDYEQRVSEDLSPSAMFQKFLDDAAVYTCGQWLEREGLDSAQTFFTTDGHDTSRDSVNDNIRHLRWQIQGRAKDSQAQVLADYEDLFFTVYQRTESQQQSWHTVCVAMFTHPDFFMY